MQTPPALSLSKESSHVILDPELLFSWLICQVNASLYGFKSAAVFPENRVKINLLHTSNHAIRSPVLHLTLASYTLKRKSLSLMPVDYTRVIKADVSACGKFIAKTEVKEPSVSLNSRHWSRSNFAPLRPRAQYALTQ